MKNYKENLDEVVFDFDAYDIMLKVWSMINFEKSEFSKIKKSVCLWIARMRNKLQSIIKCKCI